MTNIPAIIDMPGSKMEWNGDVLAATLRNVGMRYIALCPGSSFRGLHESLTNFLGDKSPDHLLCLHEEHCVSIAHGYAKLMSDPMGVLVHSNVGLMHATMAIYNAFCDRVPVFVMAGTAALDASRRVAPAHWLHSSLDQGELVRNYVKWDDMPISASSTVESIMRAWNIAQTAPRGPVFLTLDQRMQEDRNEKIEALPDPKRYRPPASPVPESSLVAEAAEMLLKAEKIVILAGRVSRSVKAWQERIEFAERLNAQVITDLKTGTAFQTNHPLHVRPASLVNGSKEAIAAVKAADLVLSLDWLDAANLFRLAGDGKPCNAKVIRASLDRYIHNGWSREHQGLAPCDLELVGEPCRVVSLLLEEMRSKGPKSWKATVKSRYPETDANPEKAFADGDDVTLYSIGKTLESLRAGKPTTIVRLPLGWDPSAYAFNHPLDYLGYDGAGGIGSGPGMGVGAALALRDSGSDRLPVVMVGDGDFLMGSSAIWTAAHHRIPLLILIVNNKSYYVDEVHQRTVSATRGRTTENSWLGQQIDDPEADMVQVAKGHGVDAEGPVRTCKQLREALKRGIKAVEAGGCYAVDIRVIPNYEPPMS
jgi:thiamine pyrophosphate-dependent acetolactate synthase large subunit-like protein